MSNQIISQETELNENVTVVEDVAVVSETEDSLKCHLREMGRFELLSAEEEQELGRRIAAGGKDAIVARNELTVANLRLAYYVAKAYVGHGVDLPDLVTMGEEGLIRACEKFDYTRGTRFSTYAVNWIRQAVIRGIANEGKTVRIPVHANELARKVRKAQKEYLVQYGTDASIKTLSEMTGLTEEKVVEGMAANIIVSSLDSKVSDDGDTTVGEMTEDTISPSPSAIAMDNALKSAIREVLGKLDAREAQVLTLRYGLDGGERMTLEEIASHPSFGVTRERVRQIETKALLKIRRSASMRNQLMDFAS